MTETGQQPATPAALEADVAGTWVPFELDAWTNLTFDQIDEVADLLGAAQSEWTIEQQTRVNLWVGLQAAQPDVPAMAHWQTLGGLNPKRITVREAGGDGVPLVDGSAPESSSPPGSPSTFSSAPKSTPATSTT
jgi:hypothetical protein